MEMIESWKLCKYALTNHENARRDRLDQIANSQTAEKITLKNNTCLQSHVKENQTA